MTDPFVLSYDIDAPDVREIAPQAINRFGVLEWKKAVLTNEIHGHLGIYSTLGAKMGLRACELLGADPSNDHISVLSFAGQNPPLSCLNDGLQVSTGATVGHGLFSLSCEDATRPEALFSCNGNTVRLSLKSEFAAQIQEDIARAVAAFGHNPQYWSRVRELAIKYWAEWDRSDIFAERLV